MSVVGGFDPDPGTLADNLRCIGDSDLEGDEVTVIDAADLIEQVVVPLWAVWSETKPPCPTCGGTGDHGDPPWEPCDCLDGVQPFNKWVAGLANATALAPVESLAALWTAVQTMYWDDDQAAVRLPDNELTATAKHLLAWLRQIGGTQ